MLWWRGEKRRESLQLRLWNLSSTSISPAVPRRLYCQISANQREAEMSANVNKHWKTRAKSNDVITNVISANQHFASTFSMQIFKFQRRSSKLSFLFPPRPAARACLQAKAVGASKAWCDSGRASSSSSRPTRRQKEALLAWCDSTSREFFVWHSVSALR